MTRGEPYGETILDDRGPHPKSAGDRLSEDGRALTLESTAPVDAGEWVALNGDGTVSPLGSDPGAISDVDGLAAHDYDPAAGDDQPERPNNGVTIHLRGAFRASIDPGVDSVDKIDDVDSDVLVHF